MMASINMGSDNEPALLMARVDVPTLLAVHTPVCGAGGGARLPALGETTEAKLIKKRDAIAGAQTGRMSFASVVGTLSVPQNRAYCVSLTESLIDVFS